MFVKSIMIPKYHCYTVSHDDDLYTVWDVLDKNQIEGVPVLDGDKYIGTITRYRLYKKAFQSELLHDEFMKGTKAKEIAKYTKALQGDEIFERVFLDLKETPLLAVVDEHEHFLGIVTRYNLIEQFQSAFGMNSPGIRVALTTVETKGRMAKLTELTRQYDVQIISLVTFDETDKLVRRIVIKIAKSPNTDKFLSKLEESGFRILHRDKE